MKKGRNRIGELLLMFLLLKSATVSYAQINVSPNQTATALAQKLAGKGVIITNATLTCASQANGFFNVVSSNLGLDSGIVLTTGRAATLDDLYGVNGPATDLASNDNGYPGDTMLESLAGQTTYDACDLEFDVLPNGDSIRFQYVFSSEEYKNAVCGPYNDAFAFFISGPGITGYDNMALVPGTSIPVMINTVNDGVPGKVGNISNCTILGAGSPFTAYYIDNSSGTTLTHWGLTTVFQAVHAVNPCSIYHLKIVITDAGDPLYDSGVFLKAGSLETNSFSVSAIEPVPADTLSFCVKGCLPGIFRVQRSEVTNQPVTVKFDIGGSAVSGVDYNAIADSAVIPANQASADVTINGLPTPPLGTKSIKLYVLPQYPCVGFNNFVDSASMLIYDTLHISMVTPDTVICGNDGILIRVAGDSFLSYTWTPATGLNNSNIQNPTASITTNTTYEVTATLPGTPCIAKTADINLSVKLTPQVVPPPDTTICYNTAMQLNAATTLANLYYSYSWTGPDGFTSNVLNPQISNVTSLNSGTYTITVRIDTNNCSAQASAQISVNTPDTPQVISPQIFCLSKPADTLTATGADLLWYSQSADTPSTTAPLPNTTEIAEYNYFVTQTTGGCTSPKSEIDVEIKKCCDGNIFIPNAFTPNGDGRNDIFTPIMDYGYNIKTIYIYNRWGQVVYDNPEGVWDGKFGGESAEMGTYFYKIIFGCILGGTVERVGDVTLIR